MTLKNLSKHERTAILIRDQYMCQKCKLEDKTAKNLEVHHIKPLGYGGSNSNENLITLCILCHKYAPNNYSKFEKYKESECDGQLTTLLKVVKDFRDNNKGLWEKVIKEHEEN